MIQTPFIRRGARLALLGLASLVALSIAACGSAQPTPTPVPPTSTPEPVQVTESASAKGGALASADIQVSGEALPTVTSHEEAVQRPEAEAHDEGEDAHDEAAAEDHQEAEEAPVDLEVTLKAVEGPDGWGFEPSLLEIPAGKRVKLTFLNTGKAEHDVEVSDLPAEHIETGTGGEDHDRLGGGGHSADVVAAHAQPGESSVVYFTPTQPGEYEFSCTLPGHKQAGMVGKLVVKVSP